ncbi:MAG: beta-lactamase family protein [Caldilinea sp.]|nr:beta-lactamase family protein [Caldilinea sp.]MDW8439832.1 serine hydrolase domain-containing protein [Caldilineaceae bacterium]
MSFASSPEFDERRFSRIAALTSELDAFAGDYARAERLPGLTYGIVAGGKLVHAAGVGLADGEAHILAGPDALFRIASMTKSVTAVAILQLRDAGLLALDDAVERYAPELGRLCAPTADSPRLTLRHLLTMTAGWPEDNPWGDRQLALDDAAFSRLLAQGVSFAAAPGVQFEYSNLAYMVLGRVVRQVSGLPFQEYVVRRILRPLGIADACWNRADAGRPVARGYRMMNGAPVEEPLAWMSCEGDAAAFAGLYMSVTDLARWVALMLSAWPARDEEEHPVLRRSSLREMQQCFALRAPKAAPFKLGDLPPCEGGGYGYGLFVMETSDLGRVIGHGGGLPGFGSHMAWLPERDVGVVALANVTYAPAAPFAMTLLRRLVKEAQLRPRPTQPAAALLKAQAEVSCLLQQWDDALADRLVAENFFLDTPREEWRRRVETLHSRHGVLQLDGALCVNNPLRGEWRMRGERGWCNVWVTLAPTVPPRVQYLTVESVLPPNETMQKTLEQLLEVIAAPTMRRISRLAASGVDRRALLDHLRLANLLYGPCSLEAIVGGDGVERTAAQLHSPRGRLEAELVIEPRTGKVRSLELRAMR